MLIKGAQVAPPFQDPKEGVAQGAMSQSRALQTLLFFQEYSLTLEKAT